MRGKEEEMRSKSLKVSDLANLTGPCKDLSTEIPSEAMQTRRQCYIVKVLKGQRRKKLSQNSIANKNIISDKCKENLIQVDLKQKIFKEAKRKRKTDKFSDKHKDVKSTRNVKYVGK